MRKVTLGPCEITSRCIIRSANCASFWPAGALPVPYSFPLPCVLICPQCVCVFFGGIWLPDSTLRPAPSICNIKPCRIHRDCSVYPSVCPPSPPQFRATVSSVSSFYHHTNSCLPCLPPPAQLPQLQLWRCRPHCSKLRLSAVCVLHFGSWVENVVKPLNSIRHRVPKISIKQTDNVSPSVL